MWHSDIADHFKSLYKPMTFSLCTTWLKKREGRRWDGLFCFCWCFCFLLFCCFFCQLLFMLECIGNWSVGERFSGIMNLSITVYVWMCGHLIIWACAVDIMNTTTPPLSGKVCEYNNNKAFSQNRTVQQFIIFYVDFCCW